MPTSSSKEPDVGTFLYNTREHRGYLFACVYGKEPATPLDIVSRVPGAPLAAHTYVRRLEDHQFRAHRAVQTQLGRALQCTSRRYGDEKDAIQRGRTCGCSPPSRQLIGSWPFPTQDHGE